MQSNRKKLSDCRGGGGAVGRGGRGSWRAGRSFQGDSYVPDLDGADGFTSECLAKFIKLHSSNMRVLVYQPHCNRLFKTKAWQVEKE